MKLVTVVGARPQFIKAAPLSAEISHAGDISEVAIHTGQHFDANMSDVFYREMGIRQPDYALDINSGGHGEMTGRMLGAIEQVLLAEKPDAVLVLGDTNSTLAGGLAAAKLHIPVVHVEAGLRSYNRRMPEEINRVLVDHLSTLLLCPTQQSVANLAQEGVTEGVLSVGDIMYDACVQFTEAARRHSRVLDELGYAPKGYAVATVHRAENTTPDALPGVMRFLEAEAERVPIVLPLHPRTRIAASQAGISLDNPRLRVTPPLGYLDMTLLLHHAAEVFTDSGGVQKEAYFHRVPCVTLRTETEWVETIEHGWNRLWSEPDYRPRSEIADYGAGDTAARILDAVRSRLMS